jgi:hypothetical protein
VADRSADPAEEVGALVQGAARHRVAVQTAIPQDQHVGPDRAEQPKPRQRHPAFVSVQVCQSAAAHPLPPQHRAYLNGIALRAAMRIALTDATVIAARLLSGCQALVSNDAQWKQRGPLLCPQFRWIYLGDYL